MAASRLKHIFLKQRSFFLIAFLFGALLLMEGFFGYHNTKNLSALSETLYKDRLIAQNYILEMQELLWSERLRLAGEHEEPAGVNRELDSIMRLYENTILTPEENVIFSRLKRQVGNTGRAQSLSSSVSGSLAELEKANHLLAELARIQLEVGGDINRESHRLIESGKILRELESGIFLVMLVLILILLKGNIVSGPRKGYELN